ncbi:N-acetylmuramoyl-L-alanine amidase [Lysobacter sp. CA199]|uniref:N-acetylmuramoyl-L-alanine amidase n=1 Tax=Lysobacter sp. CA199 TaxID=3455608 RepID=UPI003F8D52A2
MRVKGVTVQKFLLGLALLAALAWNLAHASEIKGLELHNGATGTRAEIVLDGAGEYKVISLKGPDRLVVDLPASRLGKSVKLPAGAGIIKSVRSGEPQPGTARIVFDLAQPVAVLKPRIEQGASGARLVLEWPGDGSETAAAVAVAPPSASPAAVVAAQPPASAPSEAEATAASNAATQKLIAELAARAAATHPTTSPAAAPTAPASAPPPASVVTAPPAAAVATTASAPVHNTAQQAANQAVFEQAAQAPVPNTVATGVPTRIATGVPTRVATGVPAPVPGSAAAMAPAAMAPEAVPPPGAVKTMKDVMRGRGMRPLIIAIDPGHGGQDPGAIGLTGKREKDVTLAIGRELARQINATPGLKAYMTRDSDVFIPLPRRAALARQAKADMFVSIHADAAENRAAKGSSVYVLSLKGASSQRARWLADKENASDLIGGVRLQQTDNTLASVLLDLTQSGHMKASEDAAGHVLDGLKDVGNNHKPHIERANFAVLRTSDMPAMLVETAFISNPDEERRLTDPSHQRALARAVLSGINTYFTRQPPPGTMYAARAEAQQASPGGFGGGSP